MGKEKSKKRERGRKGQRSIGEDGRRGEERAGKRNEGTENRGKGRLRMKKNDRRDVSRRQNSTSSSNNKTTTTTTSLCRRGHLSRHRRHITSKLIKSRLWPSTDSIVIIVTAIIHRIRYVCRLSRRRSQLMKTNRKPYARTRHSAYRRWLLRLS